MLLLVRHGETVWNRERKNQGRLDSPLTERGLTQANAIGRLLASLPQAAGASIATSPLHRALRTAEVIRKHVCCTGVLKIDERLRELSLGSWDGLTYDEIAARSPGIFEGEGRYEWYFRSPDGETYAAFAERVGGWLAEQSDASSTIIVTHGLVGRVLRGLYAGLPRAEALSLSASHDRVFSLSDGSIETLTVRGARQLE
jgi:broad specificity phosphatase PhoE